MFAGKDFTPAVIDEVQKDSPAELSGMKKNDIILEIDNPKVYDYLEELLGTNFRLDHDYADIIRSDKGPIGTTLHGGGTPFNPSMYYHFDDGRMYNGLTVVAYNLQELILEMVDSVVFLVAIRAITIFLMNGDN